MTVKKESLVFTTGMLKHQGQPVVSTCNPQGAFLQNSSRNKPFGPAPFWKTQRPSDHKDDSDSKECNNKDQLVSIPIHYPLHFCLRGKELEQTTHFEHSTLIKIKRIKSIDSNFDSTTVERGGNER